MPPTQPRTMTHLCRAQAMPPNGRAWQPGRRWNDIRWDGQAVVKRMARDDARRRALLPRTSRMPAQPAMLGHLVEVDAAPIEILGARCTDDRQRLAPDRSGAFEAGAVIKRRGLRFAQRRRRPGPLLVEQPAPAQRVEHVARIAAGEAMHEDSADAVTDPQGWRAVATAFAMSRDWTRN